MPLLDPTSNESKYPKLSSAALIGATTPNSTRLWVRLYRPGTWYLAVTTNPMRGDMVRLDDLPVTQYFERNAIKPVYLQAKTLGFDTDVTGVFDVTGLKPATTYYYALISDETDAGKVGRRTEIGGDRPRFFVTPPKASSTLTFGFYSCHDPISADGSAGAWPLMHQQLADQRASFVIGGGDQVYVDTNKKNGFLDIWEWLKDNKDELLQAYSKGKGKGYDKAGIERYLCNLYRWFYRVYWNVPAQREIYERLPQYMIWDDHEIMDGWGSLTKVERRKRISLLFERSNNTTTNQMLVDLMWRAACRVYYEYEHSHNPSTPIDLDNPDACQWDYAFEQGQSAFYVLDMRGHHDIEANDPCKLLGSEQMARFTAWLTSAPVQKADAVFVVAPVPVMHWRNAVTNYADIGSFKDDCMDEWDHESNQAERKRLLDAVFEALGNSARPVVFLSGDVHCAAVFRLLHKRYPAAKVFQVTSSAISRMPAPGVLKLAISAGGSMPGVKDVICERWYAMAGSKNFAMLQVRPSLDGSQTEVLVELHWPGGDDGELTKRRVLLK